MGSSRWNKICVGKNMLRIQNVRKLRHAYVPRASLLGNNLPQNHMYNAHHGVPCHSLPVCGETDAVDAGISLDSNSYTQQSFNLKQATPNWILFHNRSDMLYFSFARTGFPCSQTELSYTTMRLNCLTRISNICNYRKFAGRQALQKNKQS